MSTNSPLRILDTSLAGTGGRPSPSRNDCGVAANPCEPLSLVVPGPLGGVGPPPVSAYTVGTTTEAPSVGSNTGRCKSATADGSGIAPRSSPEAGR